MKQVIAGFENRRGAQKTAGLGAAGMIHLLQNLGLKGAIRGKSLPKSMAKNFQEGFQGKQRGKLRQFWDSAVSNIALPEAHAMREEFRQLGGKASKALAERGIKDIKPREMVVVRNLMRGNISNFTKYYDPQNPVHTTALAAFAKKFNIDPKVLQSLTPENAAKFEAAFKSKQSPLTSNIMANLMQGGKGGGKGAFKPVPVSGKAEKIHHGAQLAGAVTANVPVTALDPVTGGFNLSKVLMTNPKAREALTKFGPTRKALQAGENVMFKNPIKSGVQRGLEGKKVSKGESGFRSIMNAAAQEAQASGNLLARATPKPIAQEGRKILNQNANTSVVRGGKQVA